MANAEQRYSNQNVTEVKVLKMIINAHDTRRRSKDRYDPPRQHL